MPEFKQISVEGMPQTLSNSKSVYDNLKILVKQAVASGHTDRWYAELVGDALFIAANIIALYEGKSSKEVADLFRTPSKEGAKIKVKQLLTEASS